MRSSTSPTFAVPGLLAVMLLLTGCPEETTNPPIDGGPDAPSCTLAYVGDKDAEIELELVTLDPTYTAKALADGGDASILFPPQGGRVIFVGVRAKNLDPCGVTLSGAVRDPISNQVRLDTRTVNLEASSDGFAESDPTDISTFSNVPVCGNNWAMSDIFDQTLTLEASVKDKSGKSKKATQSLVPRCDETKTEAGVDLQKECLCLCKKDYKTGEDCGSSQ